jgi:hypothetical protein
MNIIKKIKQRIKIMKDKKTFKETMYDYNNINEYYSYYGNIVYISNDYLLNEDYFLIINNKTKFALVHVSSEDLIRFNSFKNRDNLIEELDNLAPSVDFVEGHQNFIHELGWYLNNFPLSDTSRNELIKLKGNPPVLWNLIHLEKLVNLHKKNKTVSTKQILHETRQLSADVFTSLVTVVNAYNTQFTLTFDWVCGNPFIDITIYHFNHKMIRRLNIFDIAELSNIFAIMSQNDDYATLIALESFQLA